MTSEVEIVDLKNLKKLSRQEAEMDSLELDSGRPSSIGSGDKTVTLDGSVNDMDDFEEDLSKRELCEGGDSNEFSLQLDLEEYEESIDHKEDNMFSALNFNLEKIQPGTSDTSCVLPNMVRNTTEFFEGITQAAGSENKAQTNDALNHNSAEETKKKTTDVSIADLGKTSSSKAAEQKIKENDTPSSRPNSGVLNESRTEKSKKEDLDYKNVEEMNEKKDPSRPNSGKPLGQEQNASLSPKPQTGDVMNPKIKPNVTEMNSSRPNSGKQLEEKANVKDCDTKQVKVNDSISSRPSSGDLSVKNSMKGEQKPSVLTTADKSSMDREEKNISERKDSSRPDSGKEKPTDKATEGSGIKVDLKLKTDEQKKENDQLRRPNSGVNSVGLDGPESEKNIMAEKSSRPNSGSLIQSSKDSDVKQKEADVPSAITFDDKSSKEKSAPRKGSEIDKTEKSLESLMNGEISDIEAKKLTPNNVEKDKREDVEEKTSRPDSGESVKSDIESKEADLKNVGENQKEDIEKKTSRPDSGKVSLKTNDAKKVEEVVTQDTVKKSNSQSPGDPKAKTLENNVVEEKKNPSRPNSGKLSRENSGNIDSKPEGNFAGEVAKEKKANNSSSLRPDSGRAGEGQTKSKDAKLTDPRTNPTSPGTPVSRDDSKEELREEKRDENEEKSNISQNDKKSAPLMKVEKSDVEQKDGPVKLNSPSMEVKRLEGKSFSKSETCDEKEDSFIDEEDRQGKNENIRNLFYVLDESNSGYISQEGFGYLIRSLGKSVAVQWCNYLIVPSLLQDCSQLIWRSPTW